MDLFKRYGAMLEGHFLLTSGLHSATYLEKFRLFEHPEVTAQLCQALAEAYRGTGVETVVGPVTGGIILAHETAKQLGVRCIFAEREVNTHGVPGMALRRGFQVRQGERLLIVEDILTTGRSIREVLEALKPFEPEIIGLGVVADRSGGRVTFGVPLYALTHLDIPTYSPEACPLCREGLPLVKPGSRT